MKNSRQKMTDVTVKCLSEFKRKIKNFTYEDLTNKARCKNIIDEIIEQNKNNLLFEILTFYEKANKHLKKQKDKKFLKESEDE